MADNHINIEAELERFKVWAATEEGNCDRHDLRENPVGSHERTVDGETFISPLVERDWTVWLAARRPAADGAALDLPPLPDGDEYSATRMLANGELAPRFTAATMRKYARDAIAHYHRKQAGEVPADWRDLVGTLAYMAPASSADAEGFLRHLRAKAEKLMSSQEGEQPTINKGESA